jgi:acetoin utilization deacetylase AcuC-like enzyme
MRGARELPPPENVRRLKVLVDKEVGALRTAHLSSSTEWLEEAPRAAMSDVLRVHDYTYIKKVQAGCAEIKGDEVKNLDGDTAVSAKSFEAAMRAAGAICHAIDQVCSGAHRNAFCVTRPPGHHAGYRGSVEGGDEAHGSAGFCLINNVGECHMMKSCCCALS